MNHKTGTLDHHRALTPRTASAGVLDTVRMVAGYIMLFLVCAIVCIASLPMRLLMPRAMRRRVGRNFIAAMFRGYLRALELMGACRFDLSALDALRDAPPVIIAPNHPCLLDAVLVLSRLPDTTCIMKGDLMRSPLLGAGARLAGYITNTPLRTMVQGAVADLQSGSHLLLFPEGTRTTRAPIGPIQGTTGLIAKYAGVPVQTVLIETNSAYLGKGWPVWRAPQMPVTYTVRLGKRFDAPCQTAAFVRDLEEYFQAELTRGQWPQGPGSAPA